MTAAAKRLARSSSPYLRQHATNPVDWYPWKDAALQRAKHEQKPILLSIGYATCHWCHQMARECFEDGELAAYMNEHFVCIKVDRDERPDLDRIYSDALMTMTGRAGWPMTLFLTEDLHPFFGGGYFPASDRDGLPGFRRVLEGVVAAWEKDRALLVRNAGQVMEKLLTDMAPSADGSKPTTHVMTTALEQLLEVFDPEWGGFGIEPKFPRPPVLRFLLQCHSRGWSRAVDALQLSLERMAYGGIYDQVGGGFHRYSTDRQWRVPHFEKTLSDSALLARIYLNAWQVTGRPLYRRVALETLDYLSREMRHQGGAFFAGQDAESDSREGLFYVWSFEDIVEAIGRDLASYLGAESGGNWEGKNVLWIGDPDPAADDAFLGARQALVDRRAMRERPAVDDKIVVSWNGLAITAFADAARVLGDATYQDVSTEAANFLIDHLRRRDGRLMRSWREGQTSGPAFLDDYAMLGLACLSLHETTLDPMWLEKAVTLADQVVALFADKSVGQLYLTGSDQPSPTRVKDDRDVAMPSATSAAIELLLRVGRVTGETGHLEIARTALAPLARAGCSRPEYHAHALTVLDLDLGPVHDVALVGDRKSDQTKALSQALWSSYRPRLVVAASSGAPPVSNYSLLDGRGPQDGSPTAYVCHDFVCERPVTDPDDLIAQLA